MTTGVDDFATSREYVDDVHVSRAAAVTTSDSNELAHYSRSLWIGGAGSLKVTMMGGDVVTLVGVLAGTMLENMRVKVIWQNGTTATNIVAFW